MLSIKSKIKNEIDKILIHSECLIYSPRTDESIYNDVVPPLILD